MAHTKIAPPHPGETLHEDFMLPLDLSANRLAHELRISATRIGDIIHGRRGITADTALRLARYMPSSDKNNSQRSWAKAPPKPKTKPSKKRCVAEVIGRPGGGEP